MFYQKAYQDMASFSDEEALLHWNKIGRKEGRFFRKQDITKLLPKDFCVEDYKILNPDLNLTEEQLYLHYHLHGKKENRPYKIDLTEIKEYPITLKKNTFIKCPHIFLSLEAKRCFYQIEVKEINYKLIGKKFGKVEFIFSNVTNTKLVIPVENHISLYSSIPLTIKSIKCIDFPEDKEITKDICIFHVHGKKSFDALKEKLNLISRFMDIVITISNPDLMNELDFSNICMCIPVINGSDINGLLKGLQIIPEKNILFFHTKSDIDSLNKWSHALFGTEERIKYCMDMCNRGCVGILEELIFNDKNPECFVSNHYYMQKLCDEFGITYDHKYLKFFGGSFFYLSSRVVTLLKQQNLQKLYTYYCPNEFSIDVNWYAMTNQINTEIATDIWYQRKDCGNVYFCNGTRDGCFPHAFERFIGYLSLYHDSELVGISTQNLLKQNNIIPTAIYFPQFHPFEENDKFWGKGFTEWTFLRETAPLIKNDVIYHPRDGYFDLRDLNVRINESEEAMNGGIEAFCYYHYWFSGKKVMYQVLEKMLTEGYPRQQFYLSWANEPWSRRWDGMTTELLAQEYGTEKDWINHFLYLEHFFRDERYMKIDGAPLFGILRVGHIKCFSEMITCWKRMAIKMGYPDIKIIGFLTSFPDSLEVFDHPNEISFTTERQPSFCNLMVPTPAENSLKQLEFSEYNNIFEMRTGKKSYDEATYLHYNRDILEAVSQGKLENGFVHYKNCPEEERVSRTLPYYYISNLERWRAIENFSDPRIKNNFRGTFVHWNNTPRNRGNPNWRATIHYDFEAGAFTQHLINMFNKILREKKEGTYPFLINAWNEWNEQSIIQPSHELKDTVLRCLEKSIRQFD